MDETFFVLEGSFLFEIDGQTLDATAGTLFFVPRGTSHRFRSTGASRGRVLVIAAPGGIDAFFEEAADSSVRLDDAFRKHGFAFDEPA
jgi:quercetin dioxygenase-like cupin family protein